MLKLVILGYRNYENPINKQLNYKEWLWDLPFIWYYYIFKFKIIKKKKTIKIIGPWIVYIRWLIIFYENLKKKY